MRPCAIIKTVTTTIDEIQTYQGNSGWAQLKKNTTKTKHCICL